MTSVDLSRTAALPPTGLPRSYIACLLTNLGDYELRGISTELALVRMLIEQFTVGDRVEVGMWPVTVYSPFDATAPRCNDGLGTAKVYERILYLSSSKEVSRQVRGIPASLTCIAYDNDIEMLTAYVTSFLRQWRTRIQDGPRRRASRRLRFASLASRLRRAWDAASDRTGIAARCNLHPNLIEMTLVDPERVAILSTDTLSMLSVELGVPLCTASTQLSVPATRALILAAIEEIWSDEMIAQLRIHGLAALTLDPDVDLNTLHAWRQLYARLTAS
jgi:hypothetical protein